MPERIQQLSAAMAAGDSDAVDAFYREYFDWMYWQARRVTRRDESFCLDVVQDAVLRVIRTVKAVESESRFRGWLRLVVQTTAFDLLRSERRRKNREAMAGPVADAVDVDSQQLDWLQQQISALDPELVNLIELRFERSWSLRKIGETLGISVGAVDGRLRRAIRNLKLSADEPALPVFDVEKVEVPAVATAAQPLVAERDDVISPELVPLDLPELVTTPAVELAVLEQIESTEPAEVISPQLPASAMPIPMKSPALDQTESFAPMQMPAIATEIISPAIEAAAPLRLAACGPVSVTAVAPVERVRAQMGPVVSSTVDPVEMEWPELVGLEDEAGRYDDAL